MAHDTLVKKKFKNEISKVRQQGDEGREDEKNKRKKSFKVKAMLKGLFGDFKKKKKKSLSLQFEGKPQVVSGRNKGGWRFRPQQ